MNDNITILFATQTGTAEELADRAVEDLTEAGFTARSHNLCDYQADQLQHESRVLVIASTWGEGEPPDDCEDFYEAFVKGEAFNLSRLRFAVLALGDTAYDDFCQFGKDLDEAFQRHGATRLCARLDCDLDQDERYPDWIEGLKTLLARVPDNFEIASSG